MTALNAANPLAWTLGVIFIASISYLFRLRLMHRAVRLNAGHSIAEAFQPELNTLKQTGEDAQNIMTHDAFRKHDSAISNNIRHLSWLQRRRLRNAWKALAYHEKDKEQQVPFYTMYADCGSLNKRRQMRPLAIARIKKVISIVS